MSSGLLNILEPSETRYILLGADLENFLKAKYDKDYPNFNYNVQHKCDRWFFKAPEEVDKEAIRQLIKEIKARQEG